MLTYLSSYLGAAQPTKGADDLSFKVPKSRPSTEDADNEPPAFPLMGSIQRAGSKATTGAGHTSTSTDDDDDDGEDDHQPEFQVSPPSPSGSRASTPPTPKALAPVPTPIAYARPRPKPSHRPFPPEPDFLVPSTGRQTASGLALSPSTTVLPPKRSKKIALAPGHSALDWARISREGGDELKLGMSGVERITMSEVKEHRKKDDAWSVFHGKVYNITPYLNYHPGGIPELMRVAGRDGTELFSGFKQQSLLPTVMLIIRLTTVKTHGWVNAELMLESCLLGMLVRESD